MRIVLLLLVVVILASCASGVQKLRKIDPGMSESQVEDIMGRRDSFAAIRHEGADFVLHKYTNRLCNGHVSMHEKCDFFVIYRDGRVAEVGVSAVRSNPPPMQYLVLFPTH